LLKWILRRETCLSARESEVPEPEIKNIENATLIF
jgi:hypothetical protein